MKIQCDKSQYIKNCNSDKSYAITYSKFSDDMVFLPKKLTKCLIIEIFKYDAHWSTEYSFEFPDWLFDKMKESNQETIKAIIKEWNKEKNL